MKVKIRYGSFETNSSSTHSLIICSDEEFEKFKNGELYMDSYSGKLLSEDQIIESEKKWHKDEILSDEELLEIALGDGQYSNYLHYLNNEYLEYYEREFTTKSGDKIVAFGLYGYDG